MTGLGKLLAVEGLDGTMRFPAAQFSPDGGLVGGLDEVRDALGTTNAWAVLNFLVNPDRRLAGRRPIELLHEGNLSEVLRAAASAFEPGA